MLRLQNHSHHFYNGNLINHHRHFFINDDIPIIVISHSLKMTSLHYKFMAAIRYKLQIRASRHVIMTTSDVIKFSRMSNPLMSPSFRTLANFLDRQHCGTQVQNKPYLK